MPLDTLVHLATRADTSPVRIGSQAEGVTWSPFYERGVLEITSAQVPDSQRQVLASGRVCTNAHYQSHAAMPWYDRRAYLEQCEFLADLSVPIPSLDYWFSGDTSLAEVTGWANVGGLASVRYAFNGCTGLCLLDPSGLDPSSLTDYFYASRAARAW